MEIHRIPPVRLGIVGGGQLGKMLAQEAKKLSCSVAVLDPASDAPAAQIADYHVVGGFADRARIWKLAKLCDVLTFEIETIDTEILREISEAGHVVHPHPGILEIIQDKLRQREFLAGHGIPVVRHARCDAPDCRTFADFGYPLVQKARRGGYDGRGVQVLRSEADFERALMTESMLEELVDIERELAVMVARAANGEVRCYPVAEMDFDESSNILDLLLTPARISAEQFEQAQRLAVRIVELFQGVGVFGIELFLTRGGELLVNEISPRPHNSGHYTIEACVTSQYEQHLRAIAGFPLGETSLLRPAAMVNLLGHGAGAPAAITGLRAALAVPGATIHLYGKNDVRPNRKMGHAVVLDDSLEVARRKALQVKECLKIRGG